jgi:small conductance mechanosensitive channel
MNEENAVNYIDKIVDFGIEYGPKLLGAILVLVLGLWIIKLITRWVGKSLLKSKIDPSLVPFLKSLTNILLKVMLIISVMGMIGIQMTSFIAVLGAAGLAIGMALSAHFRILPEG